MVEAVKSAQIQDVFKDKRKSRELIAGLDMEVGESGIKENNLV